MEELQNLVIQMQRDGKPEEEIKKFIREYKLSNPEAFKSKPAVEDVAIATETSISETVQNINKTTEKIVDSGTGFSIEQKEQLKNDFSEEFDNFYDGRVPEFTTSVQDATGAIGAAVDETKLPTMPGPMAGVGFILGNIQAEITKGLGVQLATSNLLPESLTPEIMESKPIMSGKDQSTFDDIENLKRVVARANNSNLSSAEVEEYIVQNKDNPVFIDELRERYVGGKLQRREEKALKDNIRSFYSNESISDKVASFVVGGFKRPKFQQENIKELEENKKIIGDEITKNEFELKILTNTINGYDKDILRIYQTVPQSQEELDALVEEGKEIMQAREVAFGTWKITANEQVDVFESDEKLNAYLDVVGRKYGLLENTAVKLAMSGVEMLQNFAAVEDEALSAIFGINKLEGVRRLADASDRWGVLGGAIKKIAGGYENFLTGDLKDNVLNKYATAEDFPEFSTLATVKGLDDFAMWMANLIGTQATQTAVMLTTGPASLPLLGLSASGGSLIETQKEIDKYGAQYTPLQRRTVALGTGLAEVFTEKVTLGILNKYAGALKKNYWAKPGFLEYTKRLLTLHGAKSLAAGTGVFAKDIFIEGSSEVAAGFFNRMLQRDILGKDIGLFEGAREEFMSGAMMVGLVYRAPGVGLQVFNAFQPGGNQQKIIELQKRYREINNQISDAPKMSVPIRTDRLNELQRIENEILKIYGLDLDVFEKMEDSEKSNLMFIADGISSLDRLHDETLDNTELDATPGIKKQILNDYNARYKYLQEEKNKLLFNIKNRLYGKKGEKAVKEEIKTTTELGKKVGRKTVALSNDEWQKMFPDNQGEEARVGEKGIMYLNKDVMLAMAIENKGYIASGTHELLHNILKGEFANPERGQKLADEFLNILKTQNREAYDAVMKRLEDRRYTAKELKDNPDEYMTQFFSYLKETDVKYEQLDKGFIESLMDWFSKTFSVATELEADNIKFKNGRDLYNFILDYSADVSKGKLSERSIELAKQGKNVTGKKSKSKAKKEVSIDELATQYKKDPASKTLEEGVVKQYTKIALTALGYNVGKGTVQPKDAISLVNAEFESILRRWDGKRKLSTWIGANIAPKKQDFYESEIGVKAKTTSLDDERAQQIAAEETSTTETKEEKTQTLIDPRTSTNVKNKIKEIEKEVKIKKEQVALANFKYISDNFGAKVASIIYNIPEAKIKDASKNLTYAKKITNGIPENSEAGSIQSDFSQVDEVRRFLKILPPYNVSTSEATINKQGETIPVSKDVKGRSLGLSGIVQDYFYENYIDPKGEITNPKGRSKGSTTQPFVKILKPQFRDNISNETIKQLQKDLGITPTGQLNTYNRSPIGQFLKGIAKLKGAITANTIIDQQIDKMDLKTAKGKKQVKADTIAGRSDDQFSKAVKAIAIKFGLEKHYYKIEDINSAKRYVGEIKEIIKKQIFLPGFLGKSQVSTGLQIEGKEKKEIRDYLSVEFSKLDFFPKAKGKDPKFPKRNLQGFINNIFDKKGALTLKDFKTITRSQILEFNKQTDINFDTGWNAIKEAVRENPELAIPLMHFIASATNNKSNFHRAGAEALAYDGRTGLTKGKTGTFYELEHAWQSSNAAVFLMESALSDVDFDKALQAVKNNYKLIALGIADNNKLKVKYEDENGKMVSYSGGMGLNAERKPWNVYKDNWWERYFNPIVGKTDGGIDPFNIKMFESDKSLGEYLKVDRFGNTLTDAQVKKLKNINIQERKAAGKNATVFSKKVSKNQSVEQQVDILENYDKAAKLSRALKTPEKGISVFDFDDTLAKTNSKVLYTLPNGKTGKLSATEFAIKSRALEDAGAIFDFSQFNKVVGGKKGPLADLALKRQGKFGSKDIFILTARPQESAQAIKAFLDGIGLSIPLDNITGLQDGTPMAKANWVASKAAEGYNNFYFADDAMKNVKAVKQILDQVDVKSDVQQAKFSKAKILNDEFNIIIEKKTGLGRNKQYSPARAKTIGASKGKFNFFIPNSAEDFVGLMYQLLGKGKEGDAQMAWLKKHLLDPFNRAEATITKDKISISNDFVELKKQFANIPKTLKKEAVDGFTYEDALRVYIWNTQGKEIPGLAKKDVKELTEFINNNQDLKTFSNELIKILKGKEYPAPTENWLSGTLTTDIIGGINTVSRAEYLQEWQENADIIFSPENMVKLEAAYGSSYVSALKNILKRMKTGTNKSNSGSKNVDDLMTWVNGSIGAIMFLNTRSAVLQTISAINFINWSDNNVLAAGKAFANQPQYWKDFMRLFNSDFLVSRRRGLKINVTESEIADAAEKGSAQGVISMLLKKGFIFTQIADSFAIASGGATFYRNRLNKLVKDGMSKEKAEEQAFLDFYAIAEESQQSSRTDRISAQQASAAGRLILAFGNTPMQYARLIKKASMDLVNGRGDWKTNVSKIVYYGVVQNVIFNALQNALFVMLFDDDDDIPQDKAVRVANGMMDSLLRGLGIGGAVVSTIKNIILKVKQESQKSRPNYDNAALEILKLSPPISSKISKLRAAGRTAAWNAKEINEKGFSLDNPAYLAGAQILSAGLNIPLDRVIKKGNNIADAISDESEYWQKVALLGGWAMWELEIPKTRNLKKSTKPSNKTGTGKREILKREIIKRETIKRN